MDKPVVKLTERNGNAFTILAACREAARKAEWSKERIEQFSKEAMAGDYDELLQTCIEYFEVE